MVSSLTWMLDDEMIWQQRLFWPNLPLILILHSYYLILYSSQSFTLSIDWHKLRLPCIFKVLKQEKKRKKSTASAQVVDCLTGRNGSCPLKRPLPSEVTSPWGSRELLQTASHTVWPFIESNQGGQASILWGTEQEKSCVVPTCLICEWAPSHLMFHCMISYKSKKLFGIMLPLYSTNS